MKTVKFRSMLLTLTLWGLLAYYLISKVWMMVVEMQIITDQNKECTVSGKCRERQ